MRKKILNFLRKHPKVLRMFWRMLGIILQIMKLVIPTKEKTMLFSSFGGRKFDDSPKAIYDEVCKRSKFDDWELTWVFMDVNQFNVPRGNKIKIDTWTFFKALLTSKVWISNSGMDRGIGIKRNDVVKVETWHGTPLKKILEDQNQNALGGKVVQKGSPDADTIRCAQSEYDRQIFKRIFNATEEAIVLCDLPRNDELLTYDSQKLQRIRESLAIAENKKIILYTPTYREYLLDENNDTYIAPPMHIEKWKEKLGNQYVMLIRAHYAVSLSMNLKENDFIKDISDYDSINDLYAIADLMISDYSSTFFDYSILGRPMLCFAYDLEEYEEKRGLYPDIRKELPFPIVQTEDEIIEHIINMDFKDASQKSIEFHMKYTPYAGHASRTVVDEIERKLAL